MDAGADLDGYCSDITRSWVIGSDGKFSLEQRDVYGVVLDALKVCVSECRGGVSLNHLHSFCATAVAAGLIRLGFVFLYFIFIFILFYFILFYFIFIFIYYYLFIYLLNFFWISLVEGTVNEVLRSRSYFTYFPHSVSHYLGLFSFLFKNLFPSFLSLLSSLPLLSFSPSSLFSFSLSFFSF